MATPENQLGVEIIADPTTAEASVERFTRTVETADQAMQAVGKNAAFGEAVAKQADQAQRAIEQTSKASSAATATEVANIQRVNQERAESTRRSSAEQSRATDETARQAQRAAGEAKKVEESLKQVGQAAPKRDVFDDLIAAAERAEKEAGDLEDAIEDSFKGTKGVATDATETFVRGLQQAQRQALALQQSGASLSTSPFKNIADDASRLSARSFQIQQQFQNLYRQLATGRPLSELNKELEDAQLKLERLNQQSVGLKSRQIGAGGGDGGGGGRGGGIASNVGRAVGYVGGQADIPGLGTLTNLLSGGGGLTLGAAALGVAGIIAYVKATSEAEQAEINLAAATRSTGRTMSESRVAAESFRAEMAANKEEAAQLAAAFGELQLRSGEAIKLGDVSAFAALANARGLSAEDAAKTIQGLARGQASSFEELTGSRASLVLDQYARSIGTTTSRLTEMERVEALATAARQRASEVTDLSARRMQSLEARTRSFTNSVKELAVEEGNAIYNRMIRLESAEETYQREVAKFDQEQAEYNRQAQIANKRKAEEAEYNRQQTAAREQDKRLTDMDRAARARPEDYGAGQSALERQRAQLAELRGQREQVQAEYEAFKKIRSQFSTDDAEKFEQQFTERIQGLTDQIRGQLESLSSAAEQKLTEFRNNILASTAEFAQLRLPTDRSNPYVRLFSEAEEAARKAQERFGLAGNAAVQEFLRAQEAMRSAQVFELRVKDSMSAVRLEFEAAELARPFTELTGEMKRALQVFKEELQAAKGAPGLRANAEAIRLQNQYQFGFNGNPRLLAQAGFYADAGGIQQNPDVVARRQLDNLMRLVGKYGGAQGIGGEQIRDQLNQELGNLYQGLSARAKGEVARSPYLTNTFARAYDEQAAYQERQIQRAVERADAQRGSLRLAERQLAELGRLGRQPNADRNVLRAEFLEVTGAVPRDELTGDLLRGRQSALLEEARYRRGSEERARKAVEETAKFQKESLRLSGEQLKAIKDRNQRVTIEVLDRSERAKTTVLGEAFK